MGSISRAQESDTYDVVVVGGGAAGIGAAIGARNANPSARILVVETESCLGGAATHRGVVSFCGLYTLGTSPLQAVGGVWFDIERRLRAINGIADKPDRHRGIFHVVEPEALKLVLDDITECNNIDVLLRTSVVGGSRRGGSAVSVDVQEKSRRRTIFAKAFVDCSGDCDLAHHVGASTRYGNHGTRNLASLATRFGGIARDATVTSKAWQAAIVDAKKRDPTLHPMCRKNGSVLLKLPLSGDVVTFLASAAYDGTSSSSISAAEASGRRQAQRYLEVLRRLPGHENMYLVSSGPNFGIRESRHLDSEYALREEDILSNTSFADKVALGAWGMEFHDEEMEGWESSFRYPPHGTFEIPLRCLRSVDTENLFAAGRCVDADKWAASAVRVMGTALATGEAAGVVAALHAQSGHVEVSKVQQVLRSHGGLLDAATLPSGPPVNDANVVSWPSALTQD
ncbi:FAD dependent oxidoreductase-domain-containing protein [Plectosphaerella cucumerina]|uniref:FAD dependent oxidoreductase-domain-containing protein n=1 Tax=Plectosphaerella cucumerina TaxID=40658 RepID=A0A8K0TF92_9PEZI|nr:FAD dependent oxidoreductase-domain-containing protein [Plectosphaerella cucumerina]